MKHSLVDFVQNYVPNDKQITEAHIMISIKLLIEFRQEDFDMGTKCRYGYGLQI